MENAPTLPTMEHNSENKESKKDKKKKAEGHLGGFVVKPEAANTRMQDGEKVSLFRRPEKNEKPVIDHEAIDTSREIQEDEQRYAVVELTKDAIQHEASPDVADPIAVAEHKGKSLLHEKILEYEGDLEAAEVATMQEYGIAETDIERDAPTPDFEDVDDIESLDEEPDETEAPPEVGTAEINEDDSEEDATVSASVSPASPPPGGNTGNSGSNGRHSGSGGGGPTPPLPPAGSPPLPPTGPPTPPYRGAGMPPVGPGIAPTAVVTPAAERIVVRENDPGTVLLVGIVGYLIGRRRGRKKAEKRLLPVQKKLRKEVKELQWQVQAKEDKIQKVAAQQARARREQNLAPKNLVTNERQPVHTANPDTKSIIAFTPRAVEVAASVVAAPSIVAERITTKERVKAPEAKEMHINEAAPNRIGRMLVVAESRPSIAKVQEKAPALKPQNVEKSIQTLNRNELLRMSETIVVDGSSLRQIYETRLVGEKGLRRLVQEHLHGGDMKKVLRREIVEREIDFERDPAMRDTGVIETKATAGGGSANTLQQLLKQADATAGNTHEEVAFLKARADHESKEQERKKQQRKIVDVSLATTIVVLTLLVAALLMR